MHATVLGTLLVEICCFIFGGSKNAAAWFVKSEPLNGSDSRVQ